MRLDRRQLLATGGAWVAACATGARPGAREGDGAELDAVLDAHRDTLPERRGAGAGHYPMAAEALEALGHADAIDVAWVRGAAGYAGELPRRGPIDGPNGGQATASALGDASRYGDWLDLFRLEIAREGWRATLAAWAPRLAPGFSAALFHGAIRTGHAARALERVENAVRREELAAGLAYWASRYVELPTLDGAPPVEDLRATLACLESPWLEERDDVPFDDVMQRLTDRPLAPAVELVPATDDTAAELHALVRETATAFLEMLVLERHRIWLLHTVTGPAAAGLLLPHVDARAARALVAHARQAAVATQAAYGEPYEPGAHVRAEPGTWSELIPRAVATRSVHTIKLVEALARHDDGRDTLARSVAAQFLEWT